MTLAVVLLYGVIIYFIAGLWTALGFVTFGVTRVLGTPTPMTFGARILIVPGVVALWPYVLVRWIKSERTP